MKKREVIFDFDLRKVFKALRSLLKARSRGAEIDIQLVPVRMPERK